MAFVSSFFDDIGGQPTIDAIVATFYQGVATDEILRPMYPEDELEGAERRLAMFLAQYWGGPTTYSDERGHPRLRMRHAPYKVNPEAGHRWLLQFKAGLDSVDLTPEQYERFWDYVTHAATFMLNSTD